MRTEKLSDDFTLSGVKIVTPQGVINKAQLKIIRGKIADIMGQKAISVTETFSASDPGDWLIPGLIDTHVHGAGGFDTMDGEAPALRGMAKMLLRLGTTAFLATTMTTTDQVLEKALRAVGNYTITAPVLEEAECLGVHLEGPFIHSEYAGAQKKDLIQAANPEKVNDYVKWSRNTLRIFTLAPEIPDAEELIKSCQVHEIIVSAGHTSATWTDAQRAQQSGIAHVTHGFNAMHPLHHREPGLIGWALSEPSVWIEMIADGIHVHPATLRLAYRLKGSEKMVLISDGTRAVGLEDGEYELGTQRVWVKDGCARLANGTLAGSRTSLLDGVKTMILKALVPVHEAVNMASIVPAKLLGIDSRMGSLEVGKDATFLKLDSSWGLKEVWIRGKMAWKGSLGD